MKRTMIGLLIATMVISLFAGCSSATVTETTGTSTAATTTAGSSATTAATTTGTTVPAEKIKIVCSTHPSQHGTPVYVAEQLGYFAEEGLEVETLIYVSGPAQMEAYLAGAWDIGTTGFGGSVAGLLNSDIVMIGCNFYGSAIQDIVARADSDIVKAGKGHVDGYPDIYGTAEDWKDLELLLTKGTISQVLLNSTLQKLGLTEADLTLTHMDPAAANTAFKAGNGDLVQAWGVYALRGAGEGWVPVTSINACGYSNPNQIICGGGFLEENPEAAVKWLRAYYRAMDYINANPEEAAQMMVDFCVENGTLTEYDDALAIMKPAAQDTLAGSIEMFTKNADGMSPMMESMDYLMQLFVKQGNYTEEDRSKFMSGDNFTDEVLKAIAD